MIIYSGISFKAGFKQEYKRNNNNYNNKVKKAIFFYLFGQYGTRIILPSSINFQPSSCYVIYII